MPTRRTFLHHAALLAAGAPLGYPLPAAAAPPYPVVRPAAAQRRFRSPAVEAVIADFSRRVRDPGLAWLFGNCFAYTLDTAVRYTETGGQPDTDVATGNDAATWLRDATAQVWPYLPLAPRDAALRQLLAGVIRRQTRCLLLDPAASARADDPAPGGAPAGGAPAPRPGGPERQGGLSARCYPLRLAYHYWKITGDTRPFGTDWRQALELVVRTFRAQQQPAAAGGGGGLIAPAGGPGGAGPPLPFPVPGNFLAVVSLRQAALMLNDIYHDDAGYADLMKLADEVALALRRHAVVPHPSLGPVYAYAVDGSGGYSLQDEAPAPSLLALPYLGAVPLTDPVYQRTRRLALSAANPFFYRGRAAEGLGSPRTGPGAIWPLALALRGLTTTYPAEIRQCGGALLLSQAGTGYLPEAFDQDDPHQLTQPRAAWANALGAEFLWKAYLGNE